MPATGLKIVGTGACLPMCSISSLFSKEFEDVWASNMFRAISSDKSSRM